MGSSSVTVHIKEETSQSLNAYADIFGQSLSQIVEEAVSDWLATTGQARMEAAQRRPIPVVLAKVIRFHESEMKEALQV